METVSSTPETAWRPQPTLPGATYFSEETFALEKDRIFHAGWFCVGREEQIASAGQYFTADVAGESVFVTRTKAGELRGFYNVCRHRGTKLCDDGPGTAKSGVFKCPYHAWTYDLEGQCVGAPNVFKEEGFDKSDYTLWPVAVDTWDGFVFVSLARTSSLPLFEQLAAEPDGPLSYARYGVGDLRVARRLEYEVQANWKIIIDNYNECLHCPSVHPELVSLVPIYRQGRVVEREDWDGVSFREGAVSFTMTGESSLPRLPGIDDVDACTYYGYQVFPNLLLNLVSDCVFSMVLYPRAPEHTSVHFEFMFRPEAIAAADFDPEPVVEFVDMVARQDWEIVERAQVGARSRAYRDGGILPHNDRLVHDFNEHYRSRMQ